MARKEFMFRGKTLEELKALELNELAGLLTARPRRSLKHGLTVDQKKLLNKLKEDRRSVKTHLRDMIILTEMVGKNILVYNGRQFVPIIIVTEMIGHYLGEFAETRKKVAHSAPGIGATRSSASLSVK